MLPIQKIKKLPLNLWLCVLPTTLYALRVIITREFYFGFLLWNLWLAYLPVLLMHSYKENEERLAKFLKFGCWLLFLPNSFYLTTDFIHLRTNSGVPPWFDALLLAAFSFSGFAFGLQSLRAVDQKILQRRLKRLRWRVLAVLCLASGYGIYLGRIDRFNSWDILLQPKALLLTIFSDVRHPIRNAEVWLVALAYGMVTLAAFSVWVKFFSKKYSASTVRNG